PRCHLRTVPSGRGGGPRRPSLRAQLGPVRPQCSARRLPPLSAPLSRRGAALQASVTAAWSARSGCLAERQTKRADHLFAGGVSGDAQGALAPGAKLARQRRRTSDVRLPEQRATERHLRPRRPRGGPAPPASPPAEAVTARTRPGLAGPRRVGGAGLGS